ncbi:MULTISPECIES: S41 family peptidase [unclassified Acinetobacter]|nr:MULTISPECIES: S41 family peptidase [unclassified Acinetobacter]MEB3796237.1 S41 family peptidase [Acinetobacter sp. IK24]MEB3815387.1 S41 family peptidase [Acinetobacter sp. IK22]MEB3834556.1 S41 family peptidase [Acinetobacter sp. IK23]MEB3838325.1 S41 family peptidase [Acinetobacter sp. IK25]
MPTLFFYTLLPLFIFFSFLGKYAYAQQPSTTLITREECKQDLDFIAYFLLHNDAGINALAWNNYPSFIQKILDTQTKKSVQAQTVQECLNTIKPFLTSIRKGHLWVSGKAMIEDVFRTHKNIQPSLKVTTKQLSNLTTYIHIPSFDEHIRTQLENIIQENQDNILQKPYLIIDVRNNNGGFDSAFKPLLMLMGDTRYWLQSPQIYTTSANIQSWKKIERLISTSSDKKFLRDIIEKMELKKSGWVNMFDQLEVSEFIQGYKNMTYPNKIIVLVGENCGSSCEQFVLYAQQNPNVTTMGQRTYGALDASNVREKQTPSGKILLSYATTFVFRHRQLNIDTVGISPD